MKWCGDQCLHMYTYRQTEDLAAKPRPCSTSLPGSHPHTLPQTSNSVPGAPTVQNRESPCLTIWDSGFCWNLPPRLPDTNSLWNKGDRGLDYLHSQHQASCGLFKFFFIRLGNSMATTQAARKPPRLKLPTSNMATWLSES